MRLDVDQLALNPLPKFTLIRANRLGRESNSHRCDATHSVLRK